MEDPQAAPAVLILVDGCRCERFIRETAAIVDPRVTILVVTTPDPFASASATPAAGTGAPSGPVLSSPLLGPDSSPGSSLALNPHTGPPGVRIRHLIDPGGVLRATVPGLPSAGALGTVLLVSADWAVVRVVSTTTSPADLKPDLDRLAA